MPDPREEKIELYCQGGTSDKVYKLELRLTQPAQPYPGDSLARFEVLFSYGRRGYPLKGGSKTSQPVSYPAAKSIFDAVKNQKLAGGYSFKGNATSPKEPRVVIQSGMVLCPVCNVTVPNVRGRLGGHLAPGMLGRFCAGSQRPVDFEFAEVGEINPPYETVKQRPLGTIACPRCNANVRVRGGVIERHKDGASPLNRLCLVSDLTMSDVLFQTADGALDSSGRYGINPKQSGKPVVPQSPTPTSPFAPGKRKIRFED